jgi:lipoic acid synthetase
MKSKKFPDWLKKRLPARERYAEIKNLLTDLNLNTVCQSAECPNTGECFSRKTATFMILGNVCTRSCRFCAVTKSKPQKVNPEEPHNVARAVFRLGLKHVVITSVTRDDLDDGGVSQFIKTVEEIRKLTPDVVIELLTPDFKGKEKLLWRLVKADFEIYNHNIETVPTLYNEVRPEADYHRSLQVLKMVKNLKPDLYTKSGIMLGLGEKKEEVLEVLKDLKEANCDFLTIGQYLQPSKEHLEVKEFIHPERFKEYKEIAHKMGFKAVASGPFVRSSYQAEKLINIIRGDNSAGI